jgi:hypothetical protein
LVPLDDVLRGAYDTLDGAGDEAAIALREEQPLADARLARVRREAVGAEADAAVHAAIERHVTTEEVAPAVAHADADAVADVVLGVARDVDAVATALGHGAVGDGEGHGDFRIVRERPGSRPSSARRPRVS